MTSRRNAMRSLGLSALALPIFTSQDLFGATEMPAADDPAYWQKIRDQYLLSKDKVFFNPGTVGVMPRVVVDKMVQHLTYLATDVADWAYKDDNKEEFIAGYNNLMGLRAKVAALVHASAAEIAMTDNVTHGMSYIANGISLQPGDEVLTSDQEHPGGRGGWLVKEKRYGIVFKTVTLPKPAHSPAEMLDLITKAFTPKTKVLMISHMITGSGAILPAKEICAEAAKRGIFTVLDGAQTVGQIKVDVKDIGCDVYLGCFHKWIGAPHGTGFMYIRAERMKDIWTTVASAQWDNHQDDGFRFINRGTGNFPMLKGLEAALDFYEGIGHDKVFERIKFLGQRLRDGLRANKKVKIFSPVDENMCAGITVYNVEGMTGTQLQDAYWAQAKMRPRSQGDTFGVRHCTHIFNSPEEIDKAVALVKGLTG